MRNVSETGLSHAGISKGFFHTGQNCIFKNISLWLKDLQILSASTAEELASNNFCVLSSKVVSCFELEFEIPTFCRQCKC